MTECPASMWRRVPQLVQRLVQRQAATHALWLGPHGLWDHGPMPGRQPRASAGASGPGPHHHASFDAWCRAMPGRGCRLVLSGCLLHELLLDPGLPLRDDTARLAYARGLLQHYHGDGAARWQLAAWHAGGRRGVSALHAMPLVTLQSSARQAGVALRSVRPWWSLALPLALQLLPALAAGDSARLLVVDGTLVTCIDLARGHLRQLQQRRLAGASPAALLALHAALPPAGCSAALGHGLAQPWPDAVGDSGGGAGGSGGGTAGLRVLGSLHGPAPAALWHGSRPATAGALAALGMAA